MDLISSVTLTKQLFELVNIIKDERDQQKVKEAAGALSEKITTLQLLNSEISSLYHSEKQRAMEICEENTKLKMFISNIEHYTLHKTPAGSITYKPQDTPENEVPSYYVCAHCYQKTIISILQPSADEFAFHMLYCPECKNKFRSTPLPLVPKRIPPPRSP